MAIKGGKWFLELAPDSPVMQAASQIFSSRAQSIRQFAEHVADEPQDDVENVHQLRVATRRYAAALTVFEPHLSKKTFRRARRSCSRIRRVAANVRDLDVKIPILNERLESCHWMKPGLAKETSRAFKRLRSNASKRLVKRIGSRTDQFMESASRIEHDLDEKNNSEARAVLFESLATENLTAKWDELREVGLRDLNDVDDLHQLRISGKRLRYSLELFAGCLPNETRAPAYQSLESLQELLGRINDLRNLYSTLANQRRRILNRMCSGDRTSIASQFDRFTATIAYDWMSRHRDFVKRWTPIGRKDMESLCRRLIEPRNGVKNKRDQIPVIGFPNRSGASLHKTARKSPERID